MAKQKKASDQKKASQFPSRRPKMKGRITNRVSDRVLSQRYLDNIRVLGEQREQQAASARAQRAAVVASETQAMVARGVPEMVAHNVANTLVKKGIIQ